MRCCLWRFCVPSSGTPYIKLRTHQSLLSQPRQRHPRILEEPPVYWRLRVLGVGDL